jgi:Cd2+/Zn2+-exporting ATPase
LSRIIRLVSEHQAKKGQYETWVEQFSRWYTPAVMAIAVASVAFHYLLWQTSLTTAIYNGLALLVIACPCALVISTPVSVVAALSTAARNGVLVKGGRALEIVGKLQRIAFDKTGTLTYGTPQVVDVVAFGEHNLEEVLTRFVAVTSRSEHPLAKAISAYVREKNIATPPLENFKAVPGQGAYGVWNDRTYRIGSPEYQLNYHVLSDEMNDTLSMWRKRGDSIVVLSSQDHLCGAIALQDRARPEAMRLLQDLKKRNIRSLVLLSGDHPDAVARIAGILGITDFRGGMLPQDKVEQIEAYRAQGELVGMVGDGINDAPALAAADSGIAMGAGTDVALETADIALINNDLKSLIWLVDHSRRMLTIIRQNIFVAISIKALFALLALFGTATLWGAIAADLGGSLLVIFNGLRLLAKKTTFSNTVTETPSLSNLNDEAKHEHR